MDNSHQYDKSIDESLSGKTIKSVAAVFCAILVVLIFYMSAICKAHKRERDLMKGVHNSSAESLSKIERHVELIGIGDKDGLVVPMKVGREAFADNYIDSVLMHEPNRPYLLDRKDQTVNTAKNGKLATIRAGQTISKASSDSKMKTIQNSDDIDSVSDNIYMQSFKPRRKSEYAKPNAKKLKYNPSDMIETTRNKSNLMSSTNKRGTIKEFEIIPEYAYQTEGEPVMKYEHKSHTFSVKDKQGSSNSASGNNTPLEHSQLSISSSGFDTTTSVSKSTSSFIRPKLEPSTIKSYKSETTDAYATGEEKYYIDHYSTYLDKNKMMKKKKKKKRKKKLTEPANDHAIVEAWDNMWGVIDYVIDVNVEEDRKKDRIK